MPLDSLSSEEKKQEIHNRTISFLDKIERHLTNCKDPHCHIREAMKEHKVSSTAPPSKD